MQAMVVDDSRAARAMLRRLLGEMGFEVVEAGDGRQALETLSARGGLDLVLVDWNMPEMNGMEFVRRVRTNPGWNGLPLMMVTTEVERTHIALALAAGANEYVMKPFTRDVLEGKLRLLGLVNGAAS